MDIRIGVVQSTKEIEIELADDTDAVKLRAEVDKVLKEDHTLWLTDRKGRQVGIPATRIAYMDNGSTEGAYRIGFGG